MNFVAVNKNVVVRVAKRPKEEKTASGIIIDTNMLRDSIKWLEGVVESVGSDIESKEITQGCTIRFDRFSGKEMDSDENSDLIVVPENCIYVVVK